MKQLIQYYTIQSDTTLDENSILDSINDYIKRVGGLKKSAFNDLVIIDPDGTTHLFNSRSLRFGSVVDIYPGSIIYAPRDIGKLSGVMYASTVSPILSSLALSLASLNSISD